MKTRIYAAAAAALLTTCAAAPAFAQNAPSWTGLYGGVFGGAAMNDEDDAERLVFDRDFDGQFDDTVTTAPPANADAFSPGSCKGSPSAVTPGAGCDDDSPGVEGGVRLGYDMQFGGFVAGVVGEVSAADVEDTVTSFSTTPASYVFTRDLESLAAVRARLGYAFGNTLAYVTGGVARGQIDNRFYTSNTANSFTVRTDEEEADGYQFGGGVEHRLTDRVSLVGEYIYTSLEAGDYLIRVGSTGTTPPANPFILPPNTAGTDMMRSNPDLEVHSVRIGMNVRF